MITSAVNNKYGVLRSFRPSSIVGSLEKSSVVTKSFESQSRNESTWEEISVNELEEPSNILSAGRCDNHNISYSEKSSEVL